MKWSIAAAATLAVLAAPSAGLAQQPAQCNSFSQLRDAAAQRAQAIRAAIEHKAERKDVCSLVQRYFVAESQVVKFLEDNKTWCNIPDEAIKNAKANHEHTMKFRTAACAEAPEAKPKPPSLSDAIGTPSIDNPSNTRTGRGTLDSLTGNPLAR